MQLISMPGGSEWILLIILFLFFPFTYILVYQLGKRSGRKIGRLEGYKEAKANP